MAELRAWAEVDLAAIGANLDLLRRGLARGTKVLVVVKADAYGHGAVPVARTVLQHGAAMLGVGDSTEALELRNAGIEAPILILGSIVDGEMEQVIAHRITPCLHSAKKALVLAAMAEAMDRKLTVHLKVDTGMGRLGVMPSAAVDVARAIQSHPALQLEGICTHLAEADIPDDPFTAGQIEAFNRAVSEVEAVTGPVPLKHAASSAGILNYPDAHFNMVRPGIAVYRLQARPRA